ncbi:serine/threonine-protein kinase Nek3-like [Gigantopelta aegis]|uniref:serine/threonine-protein kinase Nek3-like n=1 Tax=Gigantopelta aegis TaxID=1735272 RepID=UPI001B887AEC|nr:serine/threonine-protein kinase Nek3-like [Gigantopelta aegis]
MDISDRQRKRRRRDAIHQLQRDGNDKVSYFTSVRTDGQEEKFAVSRESLSHISDKERRYVVKGLTALAGLSHENIVAYVDSWEDDSNIYLVTEFCEYGNLGDYVRQRPSRESDATYSHWLLDISRALQYIHERGVIHRNVKPESIMVSRRSSQTVLKLGHFRIPKVLELGSSVTQTVLGTPRFMSPEMQNGETYNAQTDIWSLGVCFSDLITDQFKTSGPSKNTVYGNVPGLEELDMPVKIKSTWCSKGLARIINMMINKDQSKRPTAAMLVEELTKHLKNTHSDLDDRRPVVPPEIIRVKREKTKTAPQEEDMYHSKDMVVTRIKKCKVTSVSSKREEAKCVKPGNERIVSSEEVVKCVNNKNSKGVPPTEEEGFKRTKREEIKCVKSDNGQVLLPKAESCKCVKNSEGESVSSKGEEIKSVKKSKSKDVSYERERVKSAKKRKDTGVPSDREVIACETVPGFSSETYQPTCCDKSKRSRKRTIPHTVTFRLGIEEIDRFSEDIISSDSSLTSLESSRSTKDKEELLHSGTGSKNTGRCTKQREATDQQRGRTDSFPEPVEEKQGRNKVCSDHLSRKTGELEDQRLHSAETKLALDTDDLKLSNLNSGTIFSGYGTSRSDSLKFSNLESGYEADISSLAFETDDKRLFTHVHDSKRRTKPRSVSRPQQSTSTAGPVLKYK